MKKLLSMVLVLAMAMTTAFATTADEFPDMREEDHWARESLEAAIENELLQGTAAGLLEPGELLTRAQMAAVLVRAFGGENEADLQMYIDMFINDWYYDEVSKAVQMNIVEGDGVYMNPNDPITREQAFAVLSRAFAVYDGDASTLDIFADGDDTSSWAVAEVAGMVEAGHVQGDQIGLRPLDNITREEFSVIMNRLLAAYVTEAGEYTELPDGSIMINVPGVTLTGVTITGDLVLGDGVGEGDITLDDVTITGDLIVRGGGEDTGVTLTGTTTVDTVKIAKTTGDITLAVESDATVSTVYVADGTDGIVVEGNYDSLVVDYSSTVYAVDSTIATVQILEDEGVVILGGDTAVTDGVILGSGTTLEVGEDSTVATLTIGADNVTITGDGVVESIVVSADATGTTVDGTAVEGGDTTDLNSTSTGGTIVSVGGGSYTAQYDVSLTLTEVGDPTNTKTSDSYTFTGTTTVASAVKSILVDEMYTYVMVDTDDASNLDINNLNNAEGLLNVLNNNAFNAVLKNRALAAATYDWASLTIVEEVGLDTISFGICGDVARDFVCDLGDVDGIDIIVTEGTEDGLTDLMDGATLSSYQATETMTIVIDGTTYTLTYNRV